METPEQKLAALRGKIDAIDESLAKLFVERTGIIHQVAALKAENWPSSCHIRPGREGQMHRKVVERFKQTDLSPLTALAIWRQLIGGSTHLESPLSAVHLGKYPEHLWLAREYFGVQVDLHEAATLTDALKKIESGKGNILILPCPTSSDWWTQAENIKEAGLSIFGALPVVTKNLPKGTNAAVALAAVTPEASGDDISYFLKGNKLVRVEGFKTEDGDAIFLGAHPRPIELE